MLLSDTTAPLLVPPAFVPVRRQPGYITIAGEVFEDETDYSIPDGRAADRPSLTADVYETPDPTFVLKIAREFGFHAACERWSMRSRGTVTQWICDGRRLEGTLKTVEDEERDRIVAVTAELCSVIRAARALEIPESRVYAAHKQAGLKPPSLSKAEKSAATKAGLEAVGLGKGMARGPRGVAVPVTATCH